MVTVVADTIAVVALAVGVRTVAAEVDNRIEVVQSWAALATVDSQYFAAEGTEVSMMEIAVVDWIQIDQAVGVVEIA